MPEDETKKDDAVSPAAEPVENETIVDEPEIVEEKMESVEVITEPEEVAAEEPEAVEKEVAAMVAQEIVAENDSSEMTVEVGEDLVETAAELPSGPSGVADDEVVPVVNDPPALGAPKEPTAESEVGEVTEIEEDEGEAVAAARKQERKSEKKPRNKRRNEEESVDIEVEVEKRQKKIVGKLLERARATIQLRKVRKLHRVLELFNEQEKVTNEDVRKLLRVSNRTARRYFDHLEEKGRIKQVGDVGKGVYYIKT